MMDNWNSLEVAKLIVSALTPIIVVVLGIWIARITRRFEQMQWASRRIIERRIDVYDEIAPLLNDLLVYFTYVGHWKELRPPQVVESKRILDRRVNVTASLFSDTFHLSYASFMNICFKTYQGWGTDARLRTDPKRYKEAAGPSWNSAWDNMFCRQSDRADSQQVSFAYQQLMKSLAEELQLGLQPPSVPSGRAARNAAARIVVKPPATPVAAAPGSALKSARPICFYRTLPQELCDMSYDIRVHKHEHVWPNDSTLRVRFLDGSTEQHDAVRVFSEEWTKDANIAFEFGDDPSAQIRIRFDSSMGSWSYVGTNCLQISREAATMNLASVDKGVVLHVLGLALGLMPEIQIPMGGIDWNHEAIFRDLSVCPDYSNADAVEWFIAQLQFDQLNGNAFDQDSIMSMPIPDDWILDMPGAPVNEELSLMDKVLITSHYPQSQ